MIFDKKFFELRENSEHVLEYTFMIPSSKGNENLEKLAKKTIAKGVSFKKDHTKSPNVLFRFEELTKWIEHCFKFTNDNCCFIVPGFNLSKETFFHVNRPSLNQEEHGYAVLEGCNRFWYFILRQNAIMSAYDKLRRFIASKNPLKSGSDFLNYLFVDYKPTKLEGSHLENINRYGLYSLMTRPNKSLPYFSLDDKCKFINNNKDEIEAFLKENKNALKYYKSRNSSLTKKGNALYEQINGLFNPKLINLPQDNTLIDFPLLQLNYLELFQVISSHKKGHNNINCNTLLGTHSNESVINLITCRKYLSEYKVIRDDLPLPGIDSNVQYCLDNESAKESSNSPDLQFELVDKLYCRYLIEKEFGIELSDFLYQSIKGHPNKDYLTGLLYVISSAFNLPNVFSRHLILQTAFDCLVNNPELSFLEQGSESLDVTEDLIDQVRILAAEAAGINLVSDSGGKILDMVPELEECQIRTNYRIKNQPKDYFSDIIITELSHKLWEQNFVQMITELTELIFPIYDNYFFNTLWNSVHSLFGESKIHDTECAVTLFKMLSCYLNNESTLKELFDVENLFDTNNFPLSCYTTEDIIRPFSYIIDGVPDEKDLNDEIELDLFDKCIKAATLRKNSLTVPDFLDIHDFSFSLKSGADAREHIYKTIKQIKFSV